MSRDFFDVLERDLTAAARRQRRAQDADARGSRRRRWPPLLLTTVACLGLGAATAGGTLLALRGSVIPAPAAQDVPPGQLPQAGTSRVLALRAADPDAGAPPWALRIARSTTGLLCSAVGEVRDGTFGLTGLDGRFRRVPEPLVDGCSTPRRNTASLIGVRVFDARRRSGVRSIVYGVGGPSLRRVAVTASGREHVAKVGASGAFLLALRGYPEDIGATVALRFADGHTERRAFGAGHGIVRDPEGANAWRVQSIAYDLRPGKTPISTCASFTPARQRRNGPVSPLACGVLGGQGAHRTGVFFAVRRIRSGTGGPTETAEGVWGRFPARTAVWGLTGEDVVQVDVTGAGVRPASMKADATRTFLAVYPGAVDPGALRVTVTFEDGSRRTFSGSTHIVDPPDFR